MTTIVYDPSLRVRGASDEDDILYGITEAPSINSPMVTDQQNRDISYQRFDGSGMANNFILSGTFDVVNLTPNVASIDVVDGIRRSNYLQGGSLRLLLKNDYCQKIFTRFMRNDQPVSYSKITAIAEGSLRKYMLQQLLDAYSGATKGQAAQRVRLADGSHNPNNILRTAKGGYVPPPTDILNEVMAAGTGYRFWITPYHYLGWRGHGIKDTATSKQISGEIAVTYSSTRWNGTLCKLLPSNYKSYLTTASAPGLASSLIPCFTNLYHTYNDPAAAGATRFTQPAWWGGSVNFETAMPSVANLDTYQYRNTSGEIVTGGDSGSSVFTVINGDLVPLGHVAYKGSIGSFFYADYLGRIQQIVTALNASGDFTLQFVDLSGFNSYPT